MSDQTITCPKCSAHIPLSQALTAQLESQYAERLEKQLADEKRKLWALAMQAAEKKQGSALKSLEITLKEKTEKLEAAEKVELELRKKSADIAERERKLELELARKLDAERATLIVKTRQEEAVAFNQKIQEKDTQLESMKKTIEDLRRKSQQGSMQVQGDAQERSLKELLTEKYPLDLISDVPTGVNGADLIQVVNGKIGSPVGTVVWESKNTKAFSDAWLAKLKQDQGKVQAELAVLVTQVLPPGMQAFGVINGVWVVGIEYVVPVIAALRLQLIEMSKVRQSLNGRDEKMSQLFEYLIGPQFRNRVENMVLAFVSLKQDLETEKRSFQRIWSKREKELEKVMANTVGMYGDLQGIVGGSLPSIPHLELADGIDAQLDAQPPLIDVP
ncbi:DUF2130 domain-containing protein [Candidatus Woesebacteria bacterium]|nr:DUF2130 domain-containing protein [Candidatus Woesebacteria bacterium]